MYELLVLSLLMHWPLHAYRIAHIANDIIGPWEKISRGSLSALLTKLEQANYITDADPSQVPFPSDSASHVYAITPAGRQRFHQLMMDTRAHQGFYQRIFRIKVLHFEFLSREDQLYLLDHYINYCQTGVRYQKSEAEEFATDPLKQQHISQPFRDAALDVMALMAQQWQLELDWVLSIRERVLTVQAKQEN